MRIDNSIRMLLEASRGRAREPLATRLIEKEVVGPDELTALVKSAEA